MNACLSLIPIKTNPTGRMVFASIFLPVLLSGCTSEPLLSRRGGVAAGELAVQSLCVLGRSDFNPVEGNLEGSDVNYIGGVIPVNNDPDHIWKIMPPSRERALPIARGTRLFVDGHARGSIPMVANLPKPGPHTVRLEIPGWQPYTLKLGNPFRLQVGLGEIESWTPVLVNCKTGGIFTAEKLASFNPYQSAATGGSAGAAFRPGPDPMLLVTTTDKPHRGWRKIGELKPLAAPRRGIIPAHSATPVPG